MSNIEFEARQLSRSLGYTIGPDDVNDNAIFDYVNGFMKEADRLWFEDQLAKPGVEMRTRKLAESLGVEFGKPSLAEVSAEFSGKIPSDVKAELEAPIEASPQAQLDSEDSKPKISSEIQKQQSAGTSIHVAQRPTRRRSTIWNWPTRQRFSIWNLAAVGAAGLAVGTLSIILFERTNPVSARTSLDQERERLREEQALLASNKSELDRRNAELDQVAKDQLTISERLANRQKTLDGRVAAIARREKEVGRQSTITSIGGSLLSRFSSLAAKLAIPGARGAGSTEIDTSIQPLAGHNTILNPERLELKWSSDGNKGPWTLEVWQGDNGAPVWPIPGEDPEPVQENSFVLPKDKLKLKPYIPYFWTVQSEGKPSSARFGFLLPSSSDVTAVKSQAAKAKSDLDRIEAYLAAGWVDEAERALSKSTLSKGERGLAGDLLQLMRQRRNR